MDALCQANHLLLASSLLAARDYKSDAGKESLNFAYCFAVSNGLDSSPAADGKDGPADGEGAVRAA